MTAKPRFLRLLSLVVGLLAFAGFHATAYGQARITFTGGLGTPLTLTLAQPVTYVITTAVTANNGPLFDFQGVGNFFPSGTSFSGNITYSINGGAAQSLYFLQSNDTNGAVSPFDNLLSGTFNAISLGSTVVLNAGSLTTPANFFSNRPLDGTFPTFITTYTGVVESTNGISPAPEPSTWAALFAGVGLLVVALRWRGASAKSR